jgi:hypothetical protein
MVRACAVRVRACAVRVRRSLLHATDFRGRVGARVWAPVVVVSLTLSGCPYVLPLLLLFIFPTPILTPFPLFLKNA